MLISSKGRYALRLAVCIAQAGPDAKVSLREVAEREELSLKYLEQIARPMVSAGLLASVRGKGGGYRLARDPQDILAGDVLRAVEGTTVPGDLRGARWPRAVPPRRRVHHGALLGRP